MDPGGDWIRNFGKSKVRSKISAVSYTHLDVYKRQVLYPASVCEAGENAFAYKGQVKLKEIELVYKEESDTEGANRISRQGRELV